MIRQCRRFQRRLTGIAGRNLRRALRVEKHRSDVVFRGHSLSSRLRVDRSREDAARCPDLSDCVGGRAHICLLDPVRGVSADLENDKAAIRRTEPFSVDLPCSRPSLNLLFALHDLEAEVLAELIPLGRPPLLLVPSFGRHLRFPSEDCQFECQLPILGDDVEAVRRVVACLRPRWDLYWRALAGEHCPPGTAKRNEPDPAMLEELAVADAQYARVVSAIRI